MTALNLGVPYITRAELVGMQPLLPLTLFDSDAQDNLIGMASRAIDAYTNNYFAASVHTERREWNKESLRSYPTYWPLIQVARFRIYVSQAQYVTIPVGQVFISNDQHYVQIVSPALIASFARPVFTLTMAI